MEYLNKLKKWILRKKCYKRTNHQTDAQTDWAKFDPSHFELSSADRTLSINQGGSKKPQKNQQLACFHSPTNPQSQCSPAFYLSNQNYLIHFWDTANFMILWPEWPRPFLTKPTLNLLKNLLASLNIHQYLKNQFIRSLHFWDSPI